MEFLSEFNFEIKHVKMKENKVVDALSRRMHVVEISLCKSDLKEKILNSLRKNEVYLQIKEAM